MKQTEFEQKLRELKQQRTDALRPLSEMINDIKERQSAKRRVIHELSEQVQRLEQERRHLVGRRESITNEWNKRISDFCNENYTESRELYEISDWALIKELNKRGFRGILSNMERTCEMVNTVNQKLNADTHSDDEEQSNIK